MAFTPSRSRPASRPPSRSTPVMAIGQRAFVDSAGNPSGSVALTDVSGKVFSAVHLADGVEVEVVAWRPRGATETRYRVRAPQGVDGWLLAENLRRELVRPPAPGPSTPPQAPPVPDVGGRRFGQRSETARPPSSGSPAPAQPAPVVDGGGRRFGQHF